MRGVDASDTGRERSKGMEGGGKAKRLKHITPIYTQSGLSRGTVKRKDGKGRDGL